MVLVHQVVWSITWGYRGVWQAFLRDTPAGLPSPLVITNKPLGYSWYPGEVLAVAKSWVEHWFAENLVLFAAHESVSCHRSLDRVSRRIEADSMQGGHFASVDDPVGFLQDIDDFVAM